MKKTLNIIKNTSVTLLLTVISFSALAHGRHNPQLFEPDHMWGSKLKNSKKIVLTVDDGPTKHTEPLLDILKQHRVQATFFVVGKFAASRPQTMARMRDEGHIVANHTYHHQPSMYKTNPEALVTEIEKTHQVIAPYMNPSYGMYFRAPGGLWSGSFPAPLNDHPLLKNYIGPIYWDIGGSSSSKFFGGATRAADWECWQKGWSVKKCLKGYLNEVSWRQGGIILLHDITDKSVELARELIPALLEQGYEFVSLDEVFGHLK